MSYLRLIHEPEKGKYSIHDAEDNMAICFLFERDDGNYVLPFKQGDLAFRSLTEAVLYIHRMFTDHHEKYYKKLSNNHPMPRGRFDTSAHTS